MPRKKKYDDTETVKMHREGWRSCEIAEYYKCSVSLISNALKRLGEQKRGSSYYSRCRTRTKPTPDEIEIINGLLLSDASLRMGKQALTARFSIASAKQGFAQKILLLLSFDLRENYTPPKDGGTINGRIIRGNGSWTIASKGDLFFNELYEKWYPNGGKKVVPPDLKITPLCLKYWFYGDGYSVYRPKKGGALGLCTDSFTREDCERLCVLIKEASKVEFHVNLDKGRPRLHCYDAKNINSFFDYIGPCDVEDFDYKWKRPPLPRTTIRKDNTSGIRRVYYRNGKWLAGAWLNGKDKHLGSFNSKEEAIAARDLAEKSAQ